MQLLPSARPEEHRSKALLLGTHGHCIAKPFRLGSHLALGSPELLHQGNVGLTDKIKLEVAQGRDVGHDDLKIAMLGTLPAVPPTAGGAAPQHTQGAHRRETPRTRT